MTYNTYMHIQIDKYTYTYTYIPRTGAACERSERVGELRARERREEGGACGGACRRPPHPRTGPGCPDL